MRKVARRAQSGFTLVEMVMVIVITGIISAIVAVFIARPVEGYVDTVARAELTDIADIALRRIARDLRLSLPNSVRVTTGADGNPYLELLLTTTGGRYLAEEDGVGTDFLRFETVPTCPADCRFEVVGPPPQPPIQVGNQIVVYNLGPGLEPADAYNCASPMGCNRATVAAVTGQVVTLSTNPFATQTPPMRSPAHRFQVVSTPVTYTCRGGSLLRFWNYPIVPAQPASAAALATAAGVRSAPLANGITSCRFDYSQLANRRTGLVGLTIGMNVPGTNAGAVTLFQQVHVDNAP
ncbi:MAG TPA: type II secretion system protein [Noviherbaspirillum sp.]|jgi:MSHA biogenesis protein MshO|uniref:type II secretion system protein n=1 Tax=Noviherbaspirillum sp. TaxID=1926288 RepID=UPI002F93A659